MALLPAVYLDCVVAIGFPVAGSVQFAATGFFYGHFRRATSDSTAIYSTFLVTNKHVVEGENVAILRSNPIAEGPPKDLPLELAKSDGSLNWVGHPDADVDVAVAPVHGRVLQHLGLRFNVFRDTENVINRERAISMGISEGDGIFVLGFPLGLVGEKLNCAIVRHGTIARIRDYLAGHTKDFLIDCMLFPGNSGGPVVTRPDDTYLQNTVPIRDAHLIGMIASSAQHFEEATDPDTKSSVGDVRHLAGLGYVVQSPP